VSSIGNEKVKRKTAKVLGGDFPAQRSRGSGLMEAGKYNPALTVNQEIEWRAGPVAERNPAAGPF